MAGDKEPYSMDRWIQQVIDNNLRDLHTCMPGRIVEFDAVTQLAKIQPLLKRVFVGDKEVDLPECLNCPVMFPRAGGFVMTFPVTAGDECMIAFSERALDTWIQSGGIQLPLDTRKHSLSDAIAILGLYSTPNALGAFHGSGIELKNVAGTTYFRLDDSGITIKGKVDIDGDLDITGNVEAVGTSTATDHISDTVSGKTHIHSGVHPGAGNSGAPVP